MVDNLTLILRLLSTNYKKTAEAKKKSLSIKRYFVNLFSQSHNVEKKTLAWQLVHSWGISIGEGDYFRKKDI